MEVLLHVSTQSDGIANVDDQSYVRYAWKFLPALAVLGVQSLFESLSFSVRTLQPYHLLRKGKAPKWVVMENLQRTPAIWACADSLLKRQWVVFFAVFPVLLAPFLPIAVSGLYTPVTTVAVQPANATVLDQFSLMQSIPVDIFNITETNAIRPYYATADNVDGGIADYAGDMILVLNRSYPQWTYARYAFSQIEFPEDGVSSTAGQNQQALSVILPAVYVDMNCSLLPAANYDLVPLNLSWALIFQNLGPENCQFGNTTATSPRVNTTLPAEYWALASSELEPPSFGNISTGCPTMMFAFGKMEGDAVSTNQASVLQCRPRIEAVDLNVTLSLPSLGVDLTDIPKPVEGTKQTLFDASFGTDSSGYVSVVPGLSDSDLYLAKEGSGLADVNSNGEAFFQAIIYGLNGTSPEELATNPEALIDGVQRVYGTITAQLINSGGRQNYVANTTAEQERPVISGQLLNLSQARLQQSAISTRILEALLVAMIASGIVTIYFMSRARQIVPKSPYTIGAVWSLLASSKMLGEDVIPPGSEWCNDEQLKSRRVFEGKSFTLGLWENGEDHLQSKRPFRLDIENE
jgi:hypothetical protein